VDSFVVSYIGRRELGSLHQTIRDLMLSVGRWTQDWKNALLIHAEKLKYGCELLTALIIVISELKFPMAAV